MKIRTDQAELAEQIRRLSAEANPSLARFRGLGTSVAVQKPAVAKPPAQSSNSGTAPRPPPAQGSPQAPLPQGFARPSAAQATALRPTPAPIVARPLPNANTAAGLLLEPFGSRGANGSTLLDPEAQASAGALPDGLDDPERQNPQTRFEARAVPERLIQAALSRPQMRAETPQVKVHSGAGEPRGPSERLAPLELSADRPQPTKEANGRSEPRAAGERTEHPVGELDRREPRELARLEMRGGAELKPRLEAAHSADQSLKPEQALPARIDAQSAAELQTLIALHAKTGAPYATALAEIRAFSTKTQRKAGKPIPTYDDRTPLARRARVRTYLVLGALLGLFLVITLAKACSG